jgi:hypothetical protein
MRPPEEKGRAGILDRDGKRERLHGHRGARAYQHPRRGLTYAERNEPATGKRLRHLPGGACLAHESLRRQRIHHGMEQVYEL